MKIIESKAKRQEDELKRREEIEAKHREIEENKKRLAEEKKREEQERIKQKEQQRLIEEKRKLEEQAHQARILHNNTSTNFGSAIKPKQIENRFHLPPNGKPVYTTTDFIDHHSSSIYKLNQPMNFNDKSKPIVLLNKV